MKKLRIVNTNEKISSLGKEDERACYSRVDCT